MFKHWETAIDDGNDISFKPYKGVCLNIVEYKGYIYKSRFKPYKGVCLNLMMLL